MILFPFNLISRSACAGLVALISAMTPMAHAQSGLTRADMPIAELEKLYLGCERTAVAGELGAGEIMQCSIIYEELKRRAFDGDFKSMKAWSDARTRLYDVAG